MPNSLYYYYHVEAQSQTLDKMSFIKIVVIVIVSVQISFSYCKETGRQPSDDWLQINPQRAFLPHKEVSLLNPVMGFLRDSKIKIKGNQGENQTHFTVCKTRQGQLGSIGLKSQNLLST